MDEIEIDIDKKIHNRTHIKRDNIFNTENEIENYIHNKICIRDTIEVIKEYIAKTKQQSNIGFLKKCLFYFLNNILKCHCKNNVYEIRLYYNLIHNYYGSNRTYLYKLKDILFYFRIAYERRKLNHRICFNLRNVLSDRAINTLLKQNVILKNILITIRSSSRYLMHHFA